jgi:hypothetical protein
VKPGRLVLVALLVAAVTPAQAQFTLSIGSDTAAGIRENVVAVIPARINGGFFTLTYVRAVLHYDTTRIQVVGADPPPFGLSVDFRPAPGRDTVIATGSLFVTNDLFSVRMIYRSGASGGSWFWLHPDSVGSGAFNQTLNVQSDIVQLCRATNLYGDVDLDDDVDSRDALIALSAAVGLPVSGFALGNGDLDGDGLTNSRDALIMLSASIGYYLSGTRLGRGVPAECPGVVAAPEAVVFRHDGPNLDTLMYLASGTTAPTLVYADFAIYDPRLAANGTDILFSGRPDGQSYQRIARIRTDGGGFAFRSPDFSYGASPDWSPTGDSIVWRYGDQIFVSDSSGAGVTSFFVSYGVGVTWRRSGSALVYDFQTGAPGLAFIGTDGDGNTPVATGLASTLEPRVDAGDTLVAFMSYEGNGIWTVPATGGTARRVVAFQETESVDLGAAGMLITTLTAGRRGIWLLAGDGGPLLRLYATQATVRDASFRRNP